MKKVLITGGAGSIGIKVIKFLLSEGKYEITVLDLRNKKAYQKLKKYQKRVNVVYGDVNDAVLMEALVKDQDYIIHLASILPPLADFSKNVGNLVDYEGTENIIKAIKYHNEKCFLIYASTTSVYDNSLGASTKEKIKENLLTNFSYNKYQTEQLIKSKLKNYTIFRVPLVLSDLSTDAFIYHVKKDAIVEVTTNIDAAYAFVKAISYSNVLNKKTFNIGMGLNGRCKYKEILDNILNNYGLSFKYIGSRVFIEKNYHSPILTDSDELEDLIHYRNDSLYNYYQRMKNKGKNRRVAKILAKPLKYL